jgi:hypothetical protein
VGAAVAASGLCLRVHRCHGCQGDTGPANTRGGAACRHRRASVRSTRLCGRPITPHRPATRAASSRLAPGAERSNASSPKASTTAGEPTRDRFLIFEGRPHPEPALGLPPSGEPALLLRPRATPGWRQRATIPKKRSAPGRLSHRAREAVRASPQPWRRSHLRVQCRLRSGLACSARSTVRTSTPRDEVHRLRHTGGPECG